MCGVTVTFCEVKSDIGFDEQGDYRRNQLDNEIKLSVVEGRCASAVETLIALAKNGMGIISPAPPPPHDMRRRAGRMRNRRSSQSCGV